MNKLKFLVLPAGILICCSCVTTVEVGPKSPKTINADAWSVSGVPKITNRRDFEILLYRMQFGTEQDRCTYFVALQLYMDLCLPFLIEHLEDTLSFEGVSYPLVSRAGIKMANGLYSKELDRGAALELFLISYFANDSPRRNVPKDREGSSELWKSWYAQRKDEFRWNSRGLYSAR